MSDKIDAVAVMSAFRSLKPLKTDKVAPDEIKNWKSLKSGNSIKSLRGYGPYFVNYYGKKIYKGEYGYYQVDSIDYNGIYVYKLSSQGEPLYHCGRKFIYMGETTKVDIMNRQPHKLVLLNKNEGRKNGN